MPTSHSTCCEGYGIGLNETGELICFGCGSPVIKPPKDGPIPHGLIQKAFLSAMGLHQELRVHGTAIWRMSPVGWIKVGELADPRHREDFLLSQLTQEPDLQPELKS